MRPQTLISLSMALLLGLMTVVFPGTEAAPVKAKAVLMKSTTPAKRAVAQTAKVNVHAVLKPAKTSGKFSLAKTKGKYTLKVTLHNPTATKASAFGLRVKHQGRLLPARLEFKRGLGPRARTTHTLQLRLPKQKRQQCVTVKLTKPRGSKLKLGTARRACLTSPMVIRGIGTSPKTKGLVRGRPTNIRQTKVSKGIVVKTRKGKLKYSDRVGVLYLNQQRSFLTLHRDEKYMNISVRFARGEFSNTHLMVKLRIRAGGSPNCNVEGGDVITISRIVPYDDIINPENNDPNNPSFRVSYSFRDLGGNQVPVGNLLQPGTTYYAKACLYDYGVATGIGSSTVRLKIQQEKPDLIVSDIAIVGNRIQFTVKNLGPGNLMPGMTYGVSGRIHYFGSEQRFSGGRIFNEDYPGGGLPPNATMRIYPNQNAVLLQQPLKIRASASAGHDANPTNGERTETWDQLKPANGSRNDAELFIQDSRFKRFNRKGIPFPYTPPHARIKIRNSGKKDAINFFVAVSTARRSGHNAEFDHVKTTSSARLDLFKPGSSVLVGRLRQGESRWVKINLTPNMMIIGYRETLFIFAHVDDDNRVVEYLESNNKQLITTIRGPGL